MGSWTWIDKGFNHKIIQNRLLQEGVQDQCPRKAEGFMPPVTFSGQKHNERLSYCIAPPLVVDREAETQGPIVTGYLQGEAKIVTKD